MKLSIIIVNYNVKYFVHQCLDSIFRSDIEQKQVEVFVVDNASSDGSISYLKKHFPARQYPRLHLIANSRNVGFGRANNQALRRANGEYILFLNPDTLLHSETLSRCLEYADAHPQMGALGTMMLRADGSFAFESRRGLPTPCVAMCKMTGLSHLFPQSRTFGKYYMRYLDKEQPVEIDIISGAFFLARHSALNKTGGFDEDYFMYGEDVDLSYRLKQNGYENHYVPYPILHYKGESTHKNTFRYVHVFYNAMLIFFKKHFHTYYLGASIPIRMAIYFKAMLSLIYQQAKAFHKYLLPVKRYKKHKFIYVGSHREPVEEMAERWWLDLLHVEASQHIGPELLPDELLSRFGINDVYTHVVYDAQDFNYGEILDAFHQSRHHAHIGIYHPGENVLITASRVYEVTEE